MHWNLRSLHLKMWALTFAALNLTGCLSLLEWQGATQEATARAIQGALEKFQSGASLKETATTVAITFAVAFAAAIARSLQVKHKHDKEIVKANGKS